MNLVELGTHNPHQSVVEHVQPFHGFDEKGPYYCVGQSVGWGRNEYVDPAPSYAHDRMSVEGELQNLQRIAPLPIPLAVEILHREFLGRTNAYCTESYDYNGGQIDVYGEQRYLPTTIIVLSGKRIPIHPAMTRYLVSHEYGHAVAYFIAKLLRNDGILTEYMEICRPDATSAYGCGNWHTNIGEVFANDFRILIAKRELEFWPHPFTRPEDSPKVVDWWAGICGKLSWTVQTPAPGCGLRT